MPSNTRIEREKLKTRYPNGIRGKSIDSLSDAQIIAIFRRLQSKNQI